MRPTIERIPNLNDLVESVPDEVVRKIQQESLAAQEVESTRENAPMSNDKKPNKSKRIRDYIESHPSAAPKDIVAALSQYGVTPSDVGNVRSKLKGAKPGKRTGTKSVVTAAQKSLPANSASSSSTGINLKALETGAQFLKEAGSLSNARELLIVIDLIRTA